MTAEVSNLLSQAVLEVSSCGSQQLSPRWPTTALAPMSLPQKQGGLLPPADTSSQASLDEGEASLEDIPPTSPQLLLFLEVAASAPQCT